MSKIALLTVSHGSMAHAALESAQMILGEQGNCIALTIDVDDTLTAAREKLQACINMLNYESGLVVFVDIFGGTPSNICGELFLNNERTIVMSGLNLPMLLAFFLNQEESFAELMDVLEESYRDGFVNIGKKLTEGEGDSNECENL